MGKIISRLAKTEERLGIIDDVKMVDLSSPSGRKINPEEISRYSQATGYVNVMVRDTKRKIATIEKRRVVAGNRTTSLTPADVGRNLTIAELVGGHQFPIVFSIRTLQSINTFVTPVRIDASLMITAYFLSIQVTLIDVITSKINPIVTENEKNFQTLNTIIFQTSSVCPRNLS